MIWNFMRWTRAWTPSWSQNRWSLINGVRFLLWSEFPGNGTVWTPFLSWLWLHVSDVTKVLKYLRDYLWKWFCMHWNMFPPKAFNSSIRGRISWNARHLVCFLSSEVIVSIFETLMYLVIHSTFVVCKYVPIALNFFVEVFVLFGCCCLRDLSITRSFKDKWTFGIMCFFDFERSPETPYPTSATSLNRTYYILSSSLCTVRFGVVYCSQMCTVHEQRTL